MKNRMKKRMASLILLNLYFFGGLSTGFAAIRTCPAPQDGYECYCPADETLDCGYIALPSSSSEGFDTFGSSQGGGGVTKSMLQVGGGDNSANSSTNVTVKDNFLKNIQAYFMGLIGIVSVSVFLYIGFMLFTAKGNEEEFKKAWKALVYAVIGLAVMPLAYIMVKIVTGFTF